MFKNIWITLAAVGLFGSSILIGVFGGQCDRRPENAQARLQQEVDQHVYAIDERINACFGQTIGSNIKTQVLCTPELRRHVAAMQRR